MEEEQRISFEIPSEFGVETIKLTKNYTLFVNEIRRFAFGNEPDNYSATNGHNINSNNHHNHGMSDEEYARFVSDMWIGIVLTMLMVFIVFALCFWYMYHKFQQWKQSYDARSQMRHSTGGTPNMDLETLPNYTLVSGLPSYDDALEQLRMNSSTNHLLINHQTLMKIFGSVKEKSSAISEKEPQQRSESPVPTYDDASQRTNVTGASAAVVINVLNDLQSVEIGQTSSTNNLAGQRPLHRFICTVVPPPSPSPPPPPPQQQQQSSTNNSTTITSSSDACYFNADDADEDDDPTHSLSAVHTSTAAVNVPVAQSPNQRKHHLIDFSSCNRGNSLNIRPEMSWIHRSALSLSKSFDNESSSPISQHYHHRSSLY